MQSLHALDARGGQQLAAGNIATEGSGQLTVQSRRECALRAEPAECEAQWRSCRRFSASCIACMRVGGQLNADRSARLQRRHREPAVAAAVPVEIEMQ